MAAGVNHDGVLDSSKVYTHMAIARIIGRNHDWVQKMITGLNIMHVKVGAIYFISGEAFMQAIERNGRYPGDGDANLEELTDTD